jgi:hypothetical protein
MIEDRSFGAGAAVLQPERVLRAEALFVEYSTGQTPSGEWFALGTVRGDAPLQAPPAWMLVGTGASIEDAIDGLRAQLELESSRLRDR